MKRNTQRRTSRIASLSPLPALTSLANSSLLFLALAIGLLLPCCSPPPIDSGSAATRPAVAPANDPIRSNPALTSAHAQDVDQVRRLLYTARGQFDLGQFEAARATYEQVLAIDPTNQAARRGIHNSKAAAHNARQVR